MPLELEKQLKEILLDDDIKIDKIINFIHRKCLAYHINATLLGMIFERYAGLSCNNDPRIAKDKTGTFTSFIRVDDLVKIHSDFMTTNGNTWARTDVSYLRKRYNIIRKRNGSKKVQLVKLDGPNKTSIRNNTIRKDIRDEIHSRNCAILDIGNPECDHKDGRYNNLNNLNLESQILDDYQPLSKAANDAKRKHCKICKSTGKRYDAKRLGYSSSFILGNEETKTCEGCYWYDPQYFNKIISQNFTKPDAS